MILKICQDNQVWDDYVLENNGHPLQLWGWGEVKTAHGWRAERLFLYDTDNRVIGAVSVLLRKLPWPFKSLAYVPRGPVVATTYRNEMLTALERYIVHSHGSVAIMIEPDSIEYSLSDGWRQSTNHVLPSRTIILDLKKSTDDLLSDMAKKTRQYIRKSSAESMQIKFVKTREELGKCLAIYHDTAQRAKFDLHSDDYYYHVFEKLGDHSPVFAAYVDDKPVAFLWLAISADTAYELYGGMNETGQQLRVNYALKWHAISTCRDWGLTRYDFGGLLDGGVTTFKKGWASEETELAGTFDKSLSPLYFIWSRGLPYAKSVMRKIKSVLKKK